MDSAGVCGGELVEWKWIGGNRKGLHILVLTVSDMGIEGSSQKRLVNLLIARGPNRVTEWL